MTRERLKRQPVWREGIRAQAHMGDSPDNNPKAARSGTDPDPYLHQARLKAADRRLHGVDAANLGMQEDRPNRTRGGGRIQSVGQTTLQRCLGNRRRADCAKRGAACAPVRQRGLDEEGGKQSKRNEHRECERSRHARPRRSAVSRAHASPRVVRQRSVPRPERRCGQADRRAA